MFINGRNTLCTHIKTEVTEIIQIPVHPKKENDCSFELY